MSPYATVIAETLEVSSARAVLVEAYLRLQYGTLGNLSRVDIQREYGADGIGATIDAAPDRAVTLAASYGLKVPQ